MARSRLSGDAEVTESKSWLRTLDGEAPLLLIAPHGGRAGTATHAALNPKVNDLHTAEITECLAQRLGAPAIINVAMDRNRLDLNRLSQVTASAPWMLDLIAHRLQALMKRHPRIAVILIHGWNVIEPRIDLGVGLKADKGVLRPPGGGQISASDEFINGPLLDLADRLHHRGITATFGLRYPGAGANNLLQAFTRRHVASSVEPLRRIAAISVRGALEAVQLELSVALRLPGRLRAATLDALTATFDGYDRRAAVSPVRRAAVERAAAPTKRSRLMPRATAGTSGAPSRVGLEFYDAAAQVGTSVSFDFGPGAAGARVITILDRQRIALFTAEGRVVRSADAIALGPLRLSERGSRLAFEFKGPAIVVEDGAAYLSVETALAKATLYETMELGAEFEPWPPAAEPRRETLIERITHPQPGGDPIFGQATGYFTIGSIKCGLNSVARAGRSFIGLGNQTFQSRRMVWAAFPNGSAPSAFEAHALVTDDRADLRSARSFEAGQWVERAAARIDAEPSVPTLPPRRIAVIPEPLQEDAVPLLGEMQSFVMLARPGPIQGRIVTSLGFATFRLGTSTGAGMFECSYVNSGDLAGRDYDDNESVE